MWICYLSQEENSNIHTLTSDQIYRFWLKGVLGKSGCCEEECKPIIIRDADKTMHLVLPGTFTDLTRVKRRPVYHL